LEEEVDYLKIKLTETQKKVLLALYGDADHRPYLKVSEIAKRTDLSFDEVLKAIGFLEHVGFAVQKD